MSKYRGYAFTINNYTDEDVALSKALNYTYIILGNEKGDEGTPHIQGFVYFKSPISFSSIKKKLPRAHIEITKGTVQQNIEYCSKQEVLFTDGTPPQVQGKRNDLESVKQAVMEQQSMEHIILNYPANYQTIKYAETIQKYLEKPRTEKPTVEWYYGKTGTGKTRTAFEKLPNAYFKDGTKWWNGYDQHENVIIDDFRPQQILFQELLRLLDRYPHQVETKGGSRQFRATHIIITSPLHPKDTFMTNENIEQLIRRIDNIQEMR
uniref:hypothetical protein n=1 Tax=Polaribacter sp. TaxID=1920175 RepID=UPI0040481752